MFPTISTDDLIDSIISYLEYMACHITLEEQDYNILYLELLFLSNIIKSDYLGGDSK